MASYVFEGEQETAFPTLGVTVKKGDVFDAPDNLDLPNVKLASGKKATPVAKEEVAESTPETLGE